MFNNMYGGALADLDNFLFSAFYYTNHCYCYTIGISPSQENGGFMVQEKDPPHKN